MKHFTRMANALEKVVPCRCFYLDGVPTCHPEATDAYPSRFFREVARLAEQVAVILQELSEIISAEGHYTVLYQLTITTSSLSCDAVLTDVGGAAGAGCGGAGADTDGRELSIGTSTCSMAQSFVKNNSLKIPTDTVFPIDSKSSYHELILKHVKNNQPWHLQRIYLSVNHQKFLR